MLLLSSSAVELNDCLTLCRKSLHLSEERMMYLKELSKKEAIYERLASALGINISLLSAFYLGILVP